jgi:hypothetical protein
MVEVNVPCPIAVNCSMSCKNFAPLVPKLVPVPCRGLAHPRLNLRSSINQHTLGALLLDRLGWRARVGIWKMREAPSKIFTRSIVDPGRKRELILGWRLHLPSSTFLRAIIFFSHFRTRLNFSQRFHLISSLARSENKLGEIHQRRPQWTPFLLPRSFSTRRSHRSPQRVKLVGVVVNRSARTRRTNPTHPRKSLGSRGPASSVSDCRCWFLGSSVLRAFVPSWFSSTSMARSPDDLSPFFSIF